MALKCLNCHLVCAADDPVCVFCGYKVQNTAPAAKSAESGSTKGKGTAMIFMIVGSAVFNSMVGPAYFSNSGARILAAGAVGAVCAVLGMFVGQMLSND